MKRVRKQIIGTHRTRSFDNAFLLLPRRFMKKALGGCWKKRAQPASSPDVASKQPDHGSSRMEKLHRHVQYERGSLEGLLAYVLYSCELARLG